MPTKEADDKFHRTRPFGEKAGFAAVERERGGNLAFGVCLHLL